MLDDSGGILNDSDFLPFIINTAPVCGISGRCE